MRTIGFGLIGTGTWGHVHAEVYATDHRSSLRAVCDLDAERARKCAAAYGAEAIYTDYREMLRDPKIEAVAVVTPDFAHADAIVAAAQSGKHIIVEKPLATTAEDLDRIAEAVSKAGVRCMVDFHCRWCPPLVVTRNNIESGELGEIVSAYLRLNDTIYVPTKMLSWAGRSSILWFLGSHTVDTLRYLLGSEVCRVYAVSRTGVLQAKGVDVPDIYQAILEFDSGAIATIENNWIVPDSNPSYNDFKVNVLGSKGMINIDLTHNQLIERYLEKTGDRPDVLDGPLIRGRHVGFVYESIRHFVECLVEDRPPQVTLEDGIRVSGVILAILESASKREPVTVKYSGSASLCIPA